MNDGFPNLVPMHALQRLRRRRKLEHLFLTIKEESKRFEATLAIGKAGTALLFCRFLQNSFQTNKEVEITMEQGGES
jgi:hypothetical protein